jgi:hypothetical protein
VNLLEYAFGQNPTQSSSAQLPPVQLSGGNLFFSFTQPDGVSGIIYSAELSTTLAPGSWTPVPDTGTGTAHIFSVPTDEEEKMFLRLKVTIP